MVLLACGASLWLLSACDRSRTVQLRFKLGQESAALHRVQLYVFDVELLRGDGTWQNVGLNTEPPWQTERVALLDLKALVAEHVLSGRGNPDGMHWGWSAHAEVGRACAALLRSDSIG